MRSRWNLLSMALAAALVGLVGYAQEAEEEKAPPDTSSKEEAPAVYTNEDLDRKYGPTEPSTPTADEKKSAAGSAEEGQVDPLKAIQEDQARSRSLKRLKAEAQKEVAAREARVKQLEQRILRISNPLLPRPELDNAGYGGGMTGEEKEAAKGLNNQERRNLAQEHLQEAQKALEEARAALAKLGS